MSIKSEFFLILMILLLSFHGCIMQQFDIDIFSYVLEHTHLCSGPWGHYNDVSSGDRSPASTLGLSHLVFLPVCLPVSDISSSVSCVLSLAPSCAILFEHYCPCSPTHAILIPLLGSPQNPTCSPSFKINQSQITKLMSSLSSYDGLHMDQGGKQIIGLLKSREVYTITGIYPSGILPVT